MYFSGQKSSKGTKVTGAVAAVAMTVGMAWLLANSMNVGGDRIEENRMELVLLSPPPPPPPPPEPEPPKEIPIEVAAAPEIPELVAPEIEFIPEEPPVITAPPAPPEPVIYAAPAPVPAAPSGAGSSPPKLLASDKPDYPSASRRAGEQGTTQLNVCVSSAGRVTSVAVARSSGHQRLDEAAAKWIRGERFAPAKINGATQEVCNHKVYYEWNLRDA